MTGNGVRHLATYRRSERFPGMWQGGCALCRVSFDGEDERYAASWAAGHNSAVYCIATASIPPWFPPTGPGDAISLGRLRDIVDAAITTVGTDAEIVREVTQRPVLFVFTEPTEEGWVRDHVGTILLDGGGSFIRMTDGEAVA